MTRSSPPPRSVGFVFLGGMIGAVARVALSTWFPVGADAFPWSTFAENVSGAFLLAFVLTVLAERIGVDPSVQLLIGTGALGAFTTYSALALELTGLLLHGVHGVAGAYAAATLVGGLAAALLGIRAGRAWPRPPRPSAGPS